MLFSKKNTKVRCDCVHRILSKSFRSLGYQIGLHPLPFISTPVIITFILSIGFIRLKLVDDIRYVYFPLNGRTAKDKNVIDSLFPPNYTDFDLSRISRIENYGLVLAEATDKGSMLQESIMDEILKLDEIIRNISVLWNEEMINYNDMCVKYEGRCVTNSVLSLRGKVEDLKRKSFRLKYPLDLKLHTYQSIPYVANIGDVSTDEEGYVNDFKSVSLIYVINPSNYTTDLLTKWQDEFFEVASKFTSVHISISFTTERLMNVEGNNFIELIWKELFLASTLIVTFAVVSCMSTDCVKSKPWMGVTCCLCSLLATISAFGLLILCGMDFIVLNLTVPFVTLGIGMDDAFVLLAAWRRTDSKESVEKRMGDTYSEAAISVTITSLTNIVSACVGMAIPYRMVRIISVYMAITLLSAYVVQITFFGGCIAMSGYREANKLHAFCCIPVERNVNSGVLRKILMADCIPSLNSFGEHISKFYSHYLGNKLCNNGVKIIILFVYFAYFAGGLYSIRFITYGLETMEIFPYDSYTSKYLKNYYEHFTKYRSRTQIVINSELDYSDPKTQQKVEDMIRKFENLPNAAGPDLTESWLRFYLGYLRNGRFWISLLGYNTSNSDDFYEVLKDIFSKTVWGKQLIKDIVFSAGGRRIIASRYFVQEKDIRDTKAETKYLHQVWKIADTSDVPIHVYSYLFDVADTGTGVNDVTIMSLCVSDALVFLVFLIFSPKLISILSAVITIASVQVCVLGYVSLWGVSINIASMVTLILSTGFCVDYSSHICYAYMSSKCDSPNDKLKDALGAAGHAVVQGCISTLLCLVTLINGPSEVFLWIFKIFFLVITFALFQGLLVLPVILSGSETLFMFCRERIKNKQTAEKVEDKTNELSTFLQRK